MTLREFYLERRRAEVPTFLKVLKALPDDRLSYKPHDRSPSAERIVWTQRFVSEQSGRWNLLRHRARWSICLSGGQTNWRISSPKWTRLRGIGLPSFITTGRWYRNSQSGNSSGSSCSMPFITEASFQHTCARWALPCPLSMAPRRTAGRCNQRGSCRFAKLRAVALK